jgi:hypothetical protein
MLFRDLIIGQTFVFTYELTAYELDKENEKQLKRLGQLIPAVFIYTKVGTNSYVPVGIKHRIRQNARWTNKFRGVCYENIEVQLDA